MKNLKILFLFCLINGSLMSVMTQEEIELKKRIEEEAQAKKIQQQQVERHLEDKRIEDARIQRKLEDARRNR